MEDFLISLLSTFGFPVRRQGSFTSEENYPDHFFTFWNNDTNPSKHYNNQLKTLNHYYSVNFYSIDPAMMYDGINAAITILKENGWMIESYGYDVASDEPTHTGRGIDIVYKQEV